MDKWEYMFVSVDGSKQLVAQSSKTSDIVVQSSDFNPRGFVVAFDRLGAEGWQLVGIDPGDHANGYWFKRPATATGDAAGAVG